jgi:hypothetical protein
LASDYCRNAICKGPVVDYTARPIPARPAAGSSAAAEGIGGVVRQRHVDKVLGRQAKPPDPRAAGEDGKVAQTCVAPFARQGWIDQDLYVEEL